MKAIFNFLLISPQTFRKQLKSPAFAALLCFLVGPLGYHRLYVKQDRRFFLTLLITIGLGLVGWKLSWIPLMVWYACFVLEGLIYLIMSFTYLNKEVGEPPANTHTPKSSDYGTRSRSRDSHSQELSQEEDDNRLIIKPKDVFEERNIDLDPLDSDQPLEKTYLDQVDQEVQEDEQAPVNPETISISLNLSDLQAESSQAKETQEPQDLAGSYPLKDMVHLEAEAAASTSEGRLDLTQADIEEYELYPTHIKAFEAVQPASDELWTNELTRRELLSHFKELINLIGTELVAHQELLADPSFSYLLNFYQEQVLSGPMKLILQSLYNLSENLLLSQYIEQSRLSSGTDLQLLQTLLPTTIFSVVEDYYSQYTQF